MQVEAGQFTKINVRSWCGSKSKKVLWKTELNSRGSGEEIPFVETRSIALNCRKK